MDRVFGTVLILVWLAAASGDATAEGRPTRFWNLTRNTISELYLAPAGTSHWGPNQCKNDKDGSVESDERLRIADVTSGAYDAKFADASGFGTFTNTSTSGLCAGGCLTNNTWLATVRGRAGYAFDRLLVYGTAGGALGDVRANFSDDPVSSATKAGWAAGAGVEFALDRNWSAKAEYLFVDLGNGSCTAACAIVNPDGPPLIPDVSVRFDESLVRAGIDYKFHS
jgi:opacity protein-like surface antigen